MSLVFVVSVVQGQELTANGLNKAKQKVWYVTFELLWKQSLRGVVENGVLKF